MSAIALCRPAELGGHVGCCQDCAHTRVPTILAATAIVRSANGGQQRLAAREAELPPTPYFHLVFSLPAALAPIAWQNRAVGIAMGRGHLFDFHTLPNHVRSRGQSRPNLLGMSISGYDPERSPARAEMLYFK